MIRSIVTFIVTVIVTFSVTCPLRATEPGRGPDPYERGEIVDFVTNPYAGRGPWTEIDALAFNDQRIWTGDRFLPVNSREGAQFIIQIEREIRAGRLNAE